MELDPIQDDLFGELNYDPPMQEWYADIELTPDCSIDVTISWDAEDGPFAPVLARARAAYLHFRQREPEHRKALAKAMLERYRNSGRIQEDMPDADELADELIAEQLSIATDGSAIVHYDDPTDLFGDHCIMADFDVDGSFIGFTLQG
jgi:hypothetical protein